jgi:hypothetical protein
MDSLDGIILPGGVSYIVYGPTNVVQSLLALFRKAPLWLLLLNARESLDIYNNG